MKRIVLSTLAGMLSILLVFLVMATRAEKKDTEPTEHTNFNYVSSLSGECFLCGEGGDPIISNYWGEDNVGIINLNTFELLRLEINRYDDHGKLIDEDAGYMQSSHLSGEDNHVHAYTFPDNGYAHVQISGVKYKIDRATIQGNLCQRCLDTVNDLGIAGVALAEYAIISFADRTIRPLMDYYTSVSSGNYDIDCEYKENGAIYLVIQYYPNRCA